MKTNQIITFYCAIFVFFAFCIAGDDGYQEEAAHAVHGYKEEIAHAVHYCEMVAVGNWKDFDKSVVCKGNK